MQIRTETFRFISVDGHTQIYGREWIPAGEVRFLFQIVHGMADYVDRYDELARFMCAAGAAVYGHDHLGHGHTVTKDEPYGYFGKRDGAGNVIGDMLQVTERMRRQHPGLPVFLFGHSMGSLMARLYCTRHGQGLTGAVFSGTSGANPLMLAVRLIAGTAILLGQGKKPARLLSRLAFGSNNDRIENAETDYDWISRDRTVVDRYSRDPWNTFLFTNRAAYDLAGVVQADSSRRWAERLPRDTAYFVISGDMDPVGNYGRGTEQVYNWMVAAGVPNVTLKLYPGGRHELTNETNRDEVYRDILSWAEQQMPGT